MVKVTISEKSRKIIEETTKPILYTYGFRWKNPTTLDVPVSKKQAIEILETGGYAHYEFEDAPRALYMTLYSANDMM